MDVWRYVDILQHFPEVEINGVIYIDVAGEYLTREDVVSRWAAHCNETKKCECDQPQKGDAARGEGLPPKEVVATAIKAQGEKRLPKKWEK